MIGKVLFLKKENSDFIGKFVCLFTKEKYSHCLIQPNQLEQDFYTTDCIIGKIYKCNIDFLEKYDIIEFNSAKEVVEKCKQLLGTPYDIVGAIHCIMPYKAEDDKKLFCSEFVAEVLKTTTDIDIKTINVTPEKLHTLLSVHYKK